MESVGPAGISGLFREMSSSDDGIQDETTNRTQAEIDQDRVEGISWLYCLVFPNPIGKKSDELNEAREEILNDLSDAKLSTHLFYSSTKRQIFCKVGATDNRLLLEADIQNYKLKLDEKSIKLITESDVDEKLYGRSPIFLDFPYPPEADVPNPFKYKGIDGVWHDMDQAGIGTYLIQETTMSPWKDLHVRYNESWERRILRDHNVQVYKTYSDGTILRPADRIKLINKALDRSQMADPEHGIPGAALNVSKLVYKGHLLASYPMQLGTSRESSKEMTPDQLYEEWNRWKRMPWQQPLERIRNYAGEKVALYFAFLGHYTMWLVPPAVIGTAIFIHQLVQLKKDTGNVNIVGAGTATIIESWEMIELPDGNYYNQTTYETELFTLVPESPFFALFIALWASVLVEFWKRKEARLALRWGMSDYERQSNTRVEFKASEIVPNPATGEPMEYYPRSSLVSKIVVSASVIAFAIIVVIAAIVGILILKVVASAPEYSTGVIPESLAPQLALVVNAVVILILGNAYKSVARLLTNWENWRTNIQWEDALITKTFVFSFVNSYATLTYFAFIKSGSDILGITQVCVNDANDLLEAAATDDDKQLIINADVCYGSLAYSLFIIFATQIIVNNLQEVGIPLIMTYVKKFLDFRAYAKAIARRAKEAADNVQVGMEDMGNALGVQRKTSVGKSDSDESLDVDLEDASVRQRMKSPVEYQFYLKNYESPFDDYLELAIQFGYVSLFVAAFPIAPLLALLNNFIEVRVDSYKVCLLSRRPELEETQDIGTWRKIFQLIGFAAVLSNAAVILFSSNLIDVDDDVRVWLWVLFVAVVLAIKVCIDYLVPDIPKEVTIQLEREHFLTRRVFGLERETEKLAEDEERRKLARQFSAAHTIDSVDPYVIELAGYTSELINQAIQKGWTWQTLFEKADTDSNGVLSLKELRVALLDTPIGEHLSRYEVTILVNSLDIDGDGTISKPEFRRLLNLN